MFFCLIVRHTIVFNKMGFYECSNVGAEVNHVAIRLVHVLVGIYPALEKSISKHDGSN